MTRTINMRPGPCLAKLTRGVIRPRRRSNPCRLPSARQWNKAPRSPPPLDPAASQTGWQISDGDVSNGSFASITQQSATCTEWHGAQSGLNGRALPPLSFSLSSTSITARGQGPAREPVRSNGLDNRQLKVFFRSGALSGPTARCENTAMRAYGEAVMTGITAGASVVHTTSFSSW